MLEILGIHGQHIIYRAADQLGRYSRLVRFRALNEHVRLSCGSCFFFRRNETAASESAKIKGNRFGFLPLNGDRFRERDRLHDSSLCQAQGFPHGGEIIGAVDIANVIVLVYFEDRILVYRDFDVIHFNGILRVRCRTHLKLSKLG